MLRKDFAENKRLQKIAVFSHPDYLEWQTTIRGEKVQISDKKACIPGNAYFRTSAGWPEKARRSRICFINIQS